MKRKVVMMGMAMMAGLPHAVCAKGPGKDGGALRQGFWDAPFMPHYSAEGKAHPLMDHLALPPRPQTGNAWRVVFAPPAAVSGPDDPLASSDKRMGILFRLDF